MRRQILLFKSVNVFQIAWSLGEASAVGNIILYIAVIFAPSRDALFPQPILRADYRLHKSLI